MTSGSINCGLYYVHFYNPHLSEGK